jgi:hypothetical protein
MELLSRKLRLFIPVLAGSGLLLAIILAVREHNLAINPPPAVVGGHISRNLFSYLLYLVFPLPLGACWIATRIHKGSLYIFAILLAVVVAFWSLSWGDRLVLVLVTIGCCALATSLFDAWRSRDHIALFLLLWILIPLPVVYYVQLPIKLLLPCVPAVILLCMRLTEAISFRVVQVASVVLIIVSTCYSLLILHSDAEFASFGRDSLYRLITPHVASGQRVWFGGQYWSYWYAPQAGATLTYPGGPQPERGDLLVTDVFAGGDQIELARFPHRTLVEEISHKYRFGRTMGAGACLYTNGCGFWLWGFGDSGQDRYELWRID